MPTYKGARSEPQGNLSARAYLQDSLSTDASLQDSVSSTGASLQDSLSTQASEVRAGPSGLLVFDWDDTLFPTTCINALEQRLGLEGVRAHEKSLAQHGRVLEASLRAAAAVGRVCIVTLAARGWVEHSAALYLPGLDLPGLLRELGAPVFYAREFLAALESPDLLDAENLKTMKMAAMSQALNEAYADAAPSSQRLNVLSIGDSPIERMALQELFAMWTTTGALAYQPNCKTLKFREKPTLTELTAELLQMIPCLPRLNDHHADLDIEAHHLLDWNISQHGHFGRLAPSSKVFG